MNECWVAEHANCVHTQIEIESERDARKARERCLLVYHVEQTFM